jgi:cytochrome c556
MTRKLALVTALVLGLGGTALAQQAFDPIKTRQAGQDLVAGTFAGVKAVITLKGDVKTLEGPGKAIQKWALVFPTLFPAGSDKGETKAAPAIWTDRAGFEKDAMALSAAAEKLSVAAKAGDEPAVAAAFKEAGEACGACHKEFRLK